jgi:RNA polymerase sigma-70 factor (ECF subfamily)
MAMASSLPKTELSHNVEIYYQQFRMQLQRYLHNLIDDPLTCEDMVQDVFLDLCQHLRNRNIQNMKAYLYQAVRYKAARFYREKYRKEEFQEYLNSGNGAVNTTEEYLNCRDLTERYTRALAALPPKCREIFSMSRQGDYSLRDIAESLKLSVQTVKNQNSKALRHMRRHLN